MCSEPQSHQEFTGGGTGQTAHAAAKDAEVGIIVSVAALEKEKRTAGGTCQTKRAVAKDSVVDINDGMAAI